MKRLLFVLLFAACGNTTGGSLITVPFSAGGVTRDSTQPFRFTTPIGWTVTLDHAVIATGPFYFNVSAPRTGAFRSGVVIVEATEQQVIDVLDPTLHDVAGAADGESGTAVAVEIGLLPPDSSNQALANQLGDGFALVSGTAVMNTTTIPFAGSIAVNQSLVTTTEPLADLERIKGAGVDLTFTATPQTLQLRIDPTHWFDQSDFSELGDGIAPPAGGYIWAIDTTFAAQLLEGVKSESGVYQFSLVADGN